MSYRIRRFLTTAVLPLALVLSSNASAELVVIVSARSPAQGLTSDQVAAIFLGQAGRFPDGQEVLALDQRVGSQERNAFYQQVTGKTPALLKAHWSKMVFTGRDQQQGEQRQGDVGLEPAAEQAHHGRAPRVRGRGGGRGLALRAVHGQRSTSTGRTLASSAARSI